jgi:predicted glycoside hydrolase/deacetylase ChbG (UPF0249 family)
MKKMIIRADDVGFSQVNDIGAFVAMEQGVVTAADVMMDCPDTEGALRKLREMPWISVGWHTHMWGAPVSAPERVPSLILQEGAVAGRFRPDLKKADDVVFEEILQELRAQMERCVTLLGRAPSTGGSVQAADSTPYARAFRQVCAEYGIALNIAYREPANETVWQEIQAAKEAGAEWAQLYQRRSGEETPDPQWRDCKIIIADASVAYRALNTDSVAEVELHYDPVRYYTEDQGNLMQYPDDVVVEQSWHPGYLDYFTYRLGEWMGRPRARHFTLARVQDVAALCSPELKAWIRENGIELMNYRDALYGTCEYQNHLRNIGSDLLVR